MQSAAETGRKPGFSAALVRPGAGSETAAGNRPFTMPPE